MAISNLVLPDLRGVTGRIRETYDRISTIVAESVLATADTYVERADDLAGVLVKRRQRLEAYTGRERRVVPTRPGRFVVAGRITDSASGVGLPYVRVRATDLDPKRSEVLGETHTDTLGYYRIEYAREDFDESGEGMPETYIDVLAERGDVVYTSPRSFVMKASETEYLPAAIDGSRVPVSRALGGKVQAAVDRRMEDLARRVRVVAPPAAPGLRSSTRGEGTAAAGEAPPVRSVRGIGPANEAKLAGRGVTDAGRLADLEPGELGEILGVGQDRAHAIIDAAKRLLRR
jgi:predicted flap endonuclease-1-like 5' DNA nuclease